MKSVALYIFGVSRHPLLYHIQWTLSAWAESAIMWVKERLNYLDLMCFVFGALLLLSILFLLFRKRKRLYSKALSAICGQYEEQIKKGNERHLAEILKTTTQIEEFKKTLKNVKNEYEERCATQQRHYQGRMKSSEKRFLEHMQKLEQDHARTHYAADKIIFELKQEIGQLRTIQLGRVKELQKKIDKLKKELSSLHENHAKKVRQSELEIRDLRKQLRLLMYKV